MTRIYFKFALKDFLMDWLFITFVGDQSNYYHSVINMHPQADICAAITTGHNYIFASS